MKISRGQIWYYKRLKCLVEIIKIHRCWIYYDWGWDEGGIVNGVIIGVHKSFFHNEFEYIGKIK
jgi:hypothetical protein